MIRYDRFDFAAPPCTGVGWFLDASQLVGFGPGFRCQAYIPFPPRRDYSRLQVSLVRNPVDWLAICHERIAAGQMHTNHLGRFESLDASSLDAFVAAYLAEIPGGVGKLYDLYKADVRVRVEDLPWAFVEFVESLGSSNGLVETVKRLSLPGRPSAFDLSDDVQQGIIRAEKEVCNAYDYW